MSVLLSALSQGTIGIQPRPVIVKARCVSSVSVGDLVRFDLSQASSIPGQGDAAFNATTNSKFANVAIGPFTGDSAGGIYGVAQTAAAAGQQADIMVCGVTNVKCASATYTAGQAVGPSGTAATATNSSPAAKIGVVLTSSGGAVTSVQILLDGSLALA
jgi:hypothetical protein